MNIKKKFFVISLITFITRIFGAVREFLMLRFIGVNADTDAFFAARKFQALFVRVFGEGAMQSAITPYIIDFESHDKPRACRIFVSRIFTVVLLFAIITSIVINVFAKKFVLLIAPGFAQSMTQLNSTIHYLRIINPTIILVALSSIYFSITAARQKLELISLYGVILNIVLMIFIVLGRDVNAIVFGHVVVCFVQYIYCNLCARHYGCQIPKIVVPKISVKTRQMLTKIMPAIIGTSIVQINVFISTIFASYLPEKSITYISYCEKLVQMPISMIGTALATILLPYIASIHVEHDVAKIDLASIVNFSLRLSLPIMIFMLFFSYTTVDILSGGSSKITTDDVMHTAKLFALMSIILPFSIVSKIMSSICMAQKQTVVPMVASIVSVVVNILVCVVSMNIGIFSMYIAVIAMIMSVVCNAFVFLYINRRCVHDVSDTLKILLSSIVMFVVLFVVMRKNIWQSSIIRCVIAGTIGFVTYASSLVMVRDKAAIGVVSRLMKHRK